MPDLNPGETIEPIASVGPSPRLNAGETIEPLPQVVSTPAEIKEKLRTFPGFMKRVAGRAAVQTGGAEAGAALGALGGPAAPVTVPLGAAIGGGLANVVGAKKLPESLGGDPGESTLSAFLWGAIPEAGARGIAGAIEKRALSKGAEAAHTAIVNALDKGPMPAEAAGAAATAVGRPSLARPPVLTGEKLTDATNSLRQDILDPINAARRKLGEPIGKAYEALKDNDKRLSEEDTADLKEAAQNVRDEMISRFPDAEPIFNKIKNFMRPKEVAAEPGSHLNEYIRKDLAEIQGGGGEVVQRGTPTAETLKLQSFTDDQIKKVLAKAKADEEAAKPPTLDQMRVLRQRVNTQLRSATGGDVHALAGLQQAIDEKLLPYLPEGINRDRELYRGFMNRFGWRDINKVNSMGTPAELGNYVFGGTPERTAEIVEGSTPEGKAALREALTDHALRAVNPDAPLDEQVKQVQKVLSPYVANGTAAKLYGKDNADLLREVFYAPAHREQMAKILAQPEQHQAFVDEWTRFVRRGNDKQLQAAEAGFQKILDSLPPAERARFTQPPVPGAEMPVLPETQPSLQSGLTPGPSKIGPAMARRAQFTGPYAVGRAAMGSPAYAAAQLVAMAGIATTSAGYRAVMQNGGAGVLARFYASPTGRVAARTMIEGLAALGSQSAREATSDSSP